MRFVKLTAIYTFLISLVFISNVFAKTHEDLVIKYIELSGIKDALASFPEQINAMSSQRQLVAKQPEKEKKINELMVGSFDIEQAEESLYNFFLQNTDIDFLQDLIKWMEKPLVKRIIEEENSPSDPDEQANMLYYIGDLQRNPPSQDRINVIQNVEKRLQLSDLTTNILVEIMQGMAKSLNSILPEDKRRSDDQIQNEISKTKSLLKETYRQQIILSLFYTYRNISNEELMEYTEFYKSDIGKRKIEVTGKALAHVLQQWFSKVGEKLIILAKEEFGKDM